MRPLACLCLAILVSLSACRTPSAVPPGIRVAIVEFVIAEGAKIRKDAASDPALGQQFAQMMVDRLRHRGLTVELVRSSDAPRGDLVVTGRMTQIGWGGTFAVFGVDGEVRKSDGTQVAVFSDERVGTGWSNAGALENAMGHVRNNVTEMIFSGRYTGGRPGSPGVLPKVVPAPTGHLPVADRLRQLDALRRDGLITEPEYEERRRRILEDT